MDHGTVHGQTQKQKSPDLPCCLDPNSTKQSLVAQALLTWQLLASLALLATSIAHLATACFSLLATSVAHLATACFSSFGILCL
eukprot:4923646-Ditylum_brightwellii.AAC.1